MTDSFRIIVCLDKMQFVSLLQFPKKRKEHFGFKLFAEQT